MTFLKGETTWDVLVDKIIDLATGAAADDNAVTATAADAWRRPNASVDRLIAPPASTDITVTQEHRAGYWLRFDDACIHADKSDSAQQFIQQTGGWTSWYSTWRELLVVTMAVVTPNTIAGDYSDAVVKLGMQSVDGVTSSYHVGGAQVTLNAAGEGTYTYTTGVSMSFKVGDPSGILKTDAYYLRLFTDTWRGGIDTWRGFGKATTAPTFTAGLGLGGVEATDWSTTADYCPPPANLLGTSASYWVTPNSYAFQGLPAWGVGYKTDVALTGARYEVTFSKNEALGQLYPYGTNTLAFQWGGSGMDAAGSTRRTGREGCYYGGLNMLKPFSGTPVATSRVQYWISVTASHLAIVLNGDSAQGGVTTHNMIARVQVEDPTNDSGCWLFGSFGNYRVWHRLGAHYLVERTSAKGVRDGGRDWQTGDGRMDFHYLGDGNWYGGEFGYTWSTYNVRANRIYNTEIASNYNYHLLPQSTDRTSLVGDPRWPLAGFALADFPAMTTESASTSGLYRPRGYVAEGLWLTSRGGWADGDELVDTSGARWMLFFPNAQSALADSLWGLALEEV